jgi:hypothetical protein
MVQKFLIPDLQYSQKHNYSVQRKALKEKFSEIFLFTFEAYFFLQSKDCPSPIILFQEEEISFQKFFYTFLAHSFEQYPHPNAITGKKKIKNPF